MSEDRLPDDPLPEPHGAECVGPLASFTFRRKRFWRLTLWGNGWAEELGRWHAVEFVLESANGPHYDEGLRGWVKHDGCCDFGFNEPVMLHLCGRKDCDVFATIFDRATALMGVKP